MKKRLLSVSAVLAVMTLASVHAQEINSSWEADATTAKLSRGFAYNNEKIFVSTRDGGAGFRVYDAHSGTLLKTLKYPSIDEAGLVYDLVNVDMSEDGSILGSPLTLTADGSGWAGGTYTIYRWENEDSEPVPFLSYDSEPYRIGEGFSVVGDVTKDAAIMVGVSTKNIVLRWIVKDGVVGDVEEITLSEDISTGAVSVATPVGVTAEDGFWYSNITTKPVLCNADGTVNAEIPEGVVTIDAGKVKPFSFDGKDYLLTIDNGQSVLIDVTGKEISSLTVDDVVFTGQGTRGTSGLGDVDVRLGVDGSLSLYSFAPDKGIFASSTEAAPVAYDLEFSNDLIIGKTVDVQYSFADLNGDLEGESVVKWYMADDAEGTNEVELTDLEGQTSFDVIEANLGKFIKYTVLPVAATGTASFEEFLSASEYKEIVNASAPVASNLAIVGELSVRDTLTVTYDYFDAEGDVASDPIVKWFRADSIDAELGDPIAESLEYTLGADDAGKYIVASLVPTTTTGYFVEGEAITVVSADTVNLPAFAPEAHDLAISGRQEVAGVLSGSYSYYDINGDTEVDSLTTQKWYRADNAEGLNKVEIATGSEYTVLADDEGKVLFFEVVPANDVEEFGESVSVATDSIAAEPAPAAPIAEDVTLVGTPEVGVLLETTYSYYDRVDDAEGRSIFKYYTSADSLGTDKVEVSSGSLYFVPSEDHLGKYIISEVTPVAKTGEILEGETVTVVSADVVAASEVGGDFERMLLIGGSKETLPSYLGSGLTERGFGVGEDYIYIPSRQNGTELIVVDKTNGSVVQKMSTAGLYHGLFKIQDVEISEDGQILACPLTTNTLSESEKGFAVYKWENEFAEPTVFVEYTGPTKGRVDKFTVVGDVSNNATIYAVFSAGSSMLKWSVVGGVPSDVEEVILEKVTSTGIQPEVAAFDESANSDILVGGRTANKSVFAADGTYKYTLEGICQSDLQSNSPVIFNFKGRSLAAFQEINTAGSDVVIVDITTGTPVHIGRTAPISNASIEYGDVEVKVYDEHFEIYHLLSNNGIATFKGTLELPELELAETSEEGNVIYMDFDKIMADTTEFATTGWTVMLDDVESNVTKVFTAETGSEIVTIELETAATVGQVVTVLYDGSGDVAAFNGMPVASFESTNVVNTVGAEAPKAEGLMVDGTVSVDETVAASYTFADANGDLEGESEFQWYYATDAEGTDKLKILGARSSEYVIDEKYNGMYIAVEVTPSALTGGQNYLVGEPTMSSFVVVSPRVGFEENILDSKMYPNPVANVLTIEASDYIETITVITLSGRTIKTVFADMSNAVSVDLSDLQSGLYIVQVTDVTGGVDVQRIVKK